MFEITNEHFSLVKDFLSQIKCDTVYGYSIIENRQKGRIFVDDLSSPKTVLFWHYCGIAFVSGVHDNTDFNQMLYKIMVGAFEENQRRIVLFVNDSNWNNTIKSLVNNAQIVICERLRFRFNPKLFKNVTKPIPNGYNLTEINQTIIEKLEGRVIPSYSWDSSEAFLIGGKGYAMVDAKNVACNAFSSAIGNGIIDIGIETMPNYRMKGLAAPTAYAMIQYCLENGFEPNWGCNATNIGSSRIAQSLGFEILESHTMYLT